MKNKGITLIALVITIIVLLILAGISIAMLTGDNGLLIKAGEAKEVTTKEGAREKLHIVLSDIQIDKISKGQAIKLDNELATLIQSYSDIESASFTGNKIQTVVDGYTFEVNGKLGIDDKKEIVKVEPENKNDWTYKIEDDGTATLLKYNGKATKLIVPNFIDGYWVKKVGGYNNEEIWGTDTVEYVEKLNSFGYNAQTTITEIIVSEGIECIGYRAFASAIALEKITFPRSVNNIGGQALYLSFANVKGDKLKEINFYKNVQVLGDAIFLGRENITINVEYEKEDVPETWHQYWSRNTFYPRGDWPSTVELVTNVNYGVEMD